MQPGPSMALSTIDDQSQQPLNSSIVDDSSQGAANIDDDWHVGSSLDYSVYTEQKLRDLMEMLSLEYDLIFARHYGEMLIRQARLGDSASSRQMDNEERKAFKDEVRRDCANKRQSMILKDFGITMA